MAAPNAAGEAGAITQKVHADIQVSTVTSGGAAIKDAAERRDEPTRSTPTVSKPMYYPKLANEHEHKQGE